MDDDIIDNLFKEAMFKEIQRLEHDIQNFVTAVTIWMSLACDWLPRTRGIHIVTAVTDEGQNNILCRQTQPSSSQMPWLEVSLWGFLQCVVALDLTIQAPQGMLYLCAVLDLCGWMVLAYRIGINTVASIITQTIRALIAEKVTGGLALHNDQGAQYTSTAYFNLSKECLFRPSVSSPGVPDDNAAMENFFGTLKSECLYRTRYSTRSEVEELIAQYIHFYNYSLWNQEQSRVIPPYSATDSYFLVCWSGTDPALHTK